MRRARSVWALALVPALFVGCGNDASPAGGDLAGTDAQQPGDVDAGPSADAVQPAAPFKVRGTLEQIYIWGAPTETEIELIDASGAVIATGTTDTYGGLVLRELSAATDLTVQLKGQPDQAVEGVAVYSEAQLPPDEALYSRQVLEPGSNYLETRDGTLLHIYVSLPGPPEDGPYPTLVNYSGYSPGQPGQKLSDLVEPFCVDFPVLCDVPNHGTGLFGGLVGYATVGVNMRGTGCSGGAYDFFEPLQLMDGYDIIEVVARQSWVKHNKVGMGGLSYPGIAQLFVAKTRPPSLAAITPMSVLADSASSTLAPGGIFNDGFALAWIENVLDRARPYGHGWIQDVIDSGDARCEEHQGLHDQMVDVVAKALANPFYTEEVAAPLDPSSWADQIDVPVFLTGQWQDEQTGPHFAALLDKFTGSPNARFTVTNGIHVDGFAPQILMEWKTFLDLYVALEIPSINEKLLPLVPLFFLQFSGVALDLPPNRFADYDSYETALADYESEPPLRVIWESGGTADALGAPLGRFETFHDAWPVPDTQARRWYFQPGGGLLATTPPTDGGASRYNHDPDAAIRTTLPTGDIGASMPPWDYRPLIAGKAAAFMTEPLAEELVMLGHGSVDLWFKATDVDADIEVHLTEVRPDGQEMLVQSGWLRASHRTLRDDATELRPVKTHLEEDNQPLVPGEWTEVRVEIMPFGHIFRTGSRVRLSVDTPGDSASRWFFILLEQSPDVILSVGHNELRPSSVVLPVIPSVEVPTELPPCPSLRGQPCRTYEPYDNVAE